jgi:hypothetical protein
MVLWINANGSEGVVRREHLRRIAVVMPGENVMNPDAMPGKQDFVIARSRKKIGK